MEFAQLCKKIRNDGPASYTTFYVLGLGSRNFFSDFFFFSHSKQPPASSSRAIASPPRRENGKVFLCFLPSY